MWETAGGGVGRVDVAESSVARVRRVNTRAMRRTMRPRSRLQGAIVGERAGAATPSGDGGLRGWMDGRRRGSLGKRRSHRADSPHAERQQAMRSTTSRAAVETRMAVMSDVARGLSFLAPRTGARVCSKHIGADRRGCPTTELLQQVVSTFQSHISRRSHDAVGFGWVGRGRRVRRRRNKPTSRSIQSALSVF